MRLETLHFCTSCLSTSTSIFILKDVNLERSRFTTSISTQDILSSSTTSIQPSNCLSSQSDLVAQDLINSRSSITHTSTEISSLLFLTFKHKAGSKGTLSSINVSSQKALLRRLFFSNSETLLFRSSQSDNSS